MGATIQCGGAGTVPSVDLAAYTVLAGRVLRSGGASLRAQAVTQDCQGSYIHTVSVADGPTLSPTDVDYTLLVPKLRSGRSVSVVVNVVQ